jgi:hypothetical protein
LNNHLFDPPKAVLTATAERGRIVTTGRVIPVEAIYVRPGLMAESASQTGNLIMSEQGSNHWHGPYAGSKCVRKPVNQEHH